MVESIFLNEIVFGSNHNDLCQLKYLEFLVQVASVGEVVSYHRHLVQASMPRQLDSGGKLFEERYLFAYFAMYSFFRSYLIVVKIDP